MKRALLIGINYTGTAEQLNGCINDITNISNFLRTSCGYASANIQVLTDAANQRPENIPTRSNMETAIVNFAKTAKSGETLVFYYSGHGSQVTDRNGDESDNKDDVLIPLDYKTKGVIIDDWLFANLTNVLPEGVKLYAFTDCCHSGTMMDLQYNIKCLSTFTKGAVTKNLPYNSADWTNKFTFSTERSKICKADVFSFSGCLDEQTSADAFLKNQSQGAFTCCLLEFLEKNTTKNNGTSRFNSGTIRLVDMLKELNCTLTIKGFNQRPQLTLGDIKDINVRFSL
jgi:hypothetical protein